MTYIWCAQNRFIHWIQGQIIFAFFFCRSYFLPFLCFYLKCFIRGVRGKPRENASGSCRQRRWKSGRSACHTNWSSAESFTCDILIAPSLMAYFTTLHKIFWGWVHDYLHQLVLSDERSSSWFTFSKWITASFTEMQMCFQSWHPIKHNAEKAIYFSENHLILFDFYGYLGFVYLCSIVECYEIW